MNILRQEEVSNKLTKRLLAQLEFIINEYAFLFSATREANLVHGDCDPSNMLVNKINDQWIITAILDWEFSLSCTYLLDLGMMLRYAHQLPPCYEKSFIAGVEETGIILPTTWKYVAKLMDLGCLLQLLSINPSTSNPIIHNDLLSLINNTVAFFTQGKDFLREQACEKCLRAN